MRAKADGNANQAGFSMVEMMISITLLSVILGSILTAFTRLEGVYQNTNRTVDMHGELRGALALMEQEVGQAGLLSFASRTMSVAVTPSANAQTITLSSVEGIFVGEKLLVGTGSSQEVVTVQFVHPLDKRITGVFAKAHASGTVVNALGVFPEGVLNTSSANQLQFYGDINGNGTLVYVQYDCNYPTGATGTLTRSSTPITSGSISTASVLVENLIANPGGTSCFQYGSSTSSGFTFITQVSVTLTVQTSQSDPQTRVFRTITKSLPNLTPRNVLSGLLLAQDSILERLQPTPPGLPLH